MKFNSLNIFKGIGGGTLLFFVCGWHWRRTKPLFCVGYKYPLLTANCSTFTDAGCGEILECWRRLPTSGEFIQFPGKHFNLCVIVFLRHSKILWQHQDDAGMENQPLHVDLLDHHLSHLLCGKWHVGLLCGKLHVGLLDHHLSHLLCGKWHVGLLCGKLHVGLLNHHLSHILCGKLHVCLCIFCMVSYMLVSWTIISPIYCVVSFQQRTQGITSGLGPSDPSMTSTQTVFSQSAKKGVWSKRRSFGLNAALEWTSLFCSGPSTLDAKREGTRKMESGPILMHLLLCACGVDTSVVTVEFCSGARQSGLVSVWHHTLVG